jgi:hypothetical protein
LVVKTFSGGVDLDDAGNFVMDNGGHEFVGPPGPAVDEAWETLLGGGLIIEGSERNIHFFYLPLFRFES